MANSHIIRRGASVWRAATKASGLSQRQIAQSLSTSQSHISKIANGLAVPSAPEWLQFAQLTGVPESSYLDGYIDRGMLVKVDSIPQIGSFCIPERYAVEQSSSARLSGLFIRYLQQCIGHCKANEFIQHLGMDPDYFTHYDFKLNVRFNLDILEYLIKEKFLKKDEIEYMSRPLADFSFHGSLKNELRDVHHPLDGMQRLTEVINRYEVNHSYQIENRTGAVLDLSVTPEERINRFQTPDFNHFFGYYIQHVFKRFTEFSPHTEFDTEISTIENNYRYGGKNVYRVLIIPHRSRQTRISTKS